MDSIRVLRETEKADTAKQKIDAKIAREEYLA